MAAKQDFVALPGIGARDERNQFVRAVAADNTARLATETLGDRLTQLRRSALRITVQGTGQILVGPNRGATGAKRCLIRRQHDHPIDPRDLVLAPDIGLDIHDSGLRFGRTHAGASLA